MSQSDCIFLWVGRLFVLYCGLKLLYACYHLWKVYIFPTYPDFSKYGKWSVVTGSTSGIGEAIAFQLASRGQNIILISRNEEKLEKVSKEIASKHGVLTKYLQIDFCDDESIYQKIEDYLKEFDIGVLVNNAGMGTPLTKFTETPDLSSLITNLTRLNMLSVTKMHQIVLPGMVERKRGYILNVSSASALQTTVNLALYAATKSFVKHFSTILSFEYEEKGITIQCCCPYFVQSNLTKEMPSWKSLLSAEAFASSLLGTIGKERTTLGNLRFVFTNAVLNLIPTKLTHKFINKQAEDINRLQSKRN